MLCQSLRFSQITGVERRGMVSGSEWPLRLGDWCLSVDVKEGASVLHRPITERPGLYESAFALQYRFSTGLSKGQAFRGLVDDGLCAT